MADKINPYDVAALEKSLNDSATRVSTIWVSFLIFGLYLLAAAATVTHRQLFLAEPVKLPVLNIDLPLWGFFFLAPILFVIFHTYVLLQVLLLGRTAAAYNDAMDRTVKPPTANAAMRQRLANTLFAQIFAGSPRERDGWLGWLLKAMAWITLAIAPILILLVFQFMFLPYHSHIVTWTHRLLILSELAVVFLLWPLILDARRDFIWPKAQRPFTREFNFSMRLTASVDWLKNSGLRLLRRISPVAACIAFICLSLLVATFPGEPHVNIFTGQPLSSAQCERWLAEKFDRLHLPGTDVVDDEKLAKIVQATIGRKLPAHGGERTRNFRGRDLNCSDLSFADLRHVDLAGASLNGANLESAVAEGALLDDAHLIGAKLNLAQLQGASLNRAKLQRGKISKVQLHTASLEDAELQGADLDGAGLQGASLRGAQLQNASLVKSELQGSNLDLAQLQGATLEQAKLQGASLNGANLQSANFYKSQLQGTSLIGAQLQGAFLMYAEFQGALLIQAKLQGAELHGAQLQGADLDFSELAHAHFSETKVWLAGHPEFLDAHVLNHDSKANFVRRFGSVTINDPATQENITKLIALSTQKIPDMSKREEISAQMRKALDRPEDEAEAIAKHWIACEAATASAPKEERERGHIDLLRGLFCDSKSDQNAIANGVIRNWTESYGERLAISGPLAQGLLGEDGKDCTAAKYLDEPSRRRLKNAVAEGKKSAMAPKTAPGDR